MRTPDPDAPELASALVATLTDEELETAISEGGAGGRLAAGPSVTQSSWTPSPLNGPPARSAAWPWNGRTP